jgi:hypothetical protein
LGVGRSSFVVDLYKMGISQVHRIPLLFWKFDPPVSICSISFLDFNLKFSACTSFSFLGCWNFLCVKLVCVLHALHLGFSFMVLSLSLSLMFPNLSSSLDMASQEIRVSGTYR